MSCCRCNRSGRCRYCSCVKSGRTCQGCLPEQLGNCKNISQSTQRLLSESDHPPSILLSSQNVTTIPEIPTASIADQTMPLDHTLSQSLEARPSVVDVTWPSPDLQPPNFSWGSCCGEVFCTRINSAYEEVVHWRRNLFQVPSGSAGKAFVSELARLFQAYADSSSLECIAMKAITVMPILLLQKPSRTSKSKDHSTHLQRRMELWLDGNYTGTFRRRQMYTEASGKHNKSIKQ